MSKHPIPHTNITSKTILMSIRQITTLLHVEDAGTRAGRVGDGGNSETFPVENQRREVFMIKKSRRVKRALNMLQREDLVSTEGREEAICDK